MDSTIANVTAIELPEVSAEHVEVSLVLWIASAALGVALLIATCCSCCVNGIKKWRLSQNSGCEGDKVSLTFRSIDLWFGSGNDRAQALKSVSGHVRSGELLAIMGPSGSGKVRVTLDIDTASEITDSANDTCSDHSLERACGIKRAGKSGAARMPHTKRPCAWETCEVAAALRAQKMGAWESARVALCYVII